jgi:hypothetical protein
MQTDNEPHIEGSMTRKEALDQLFADKNLERDLPPNMRATFRKWRSRNKKGKLDAGKQTEILDYFAYSIVVEERWGLRVEKSKSARPDESGEIRSDKMNRGDLFKIHANGPTCEVRQPYSETRCVVYVVLENYVRASKLRKKAGQQGKLFGFERVTVVKDPLAHMYDTTGEHETCEFCDRRKDSPNFDYHFCSGRKTKAGGRRD